MIAYYLPGVAFTEALSFVASSRLCTMPSWRALNDGQGGSIVHLAGWVRATAIPPRKTKEGWGYSPNGADLPRIAALLRRERPESDPVTLTDGQSLWMPLLQKSSRRFYFEPGGGGYGPYIDKWALMALRLWRDCQAPDGKGGMETRLSHANMSDLLATFYACLSQCYYLTHELLGDILPISDIDLCRAIYGIWGGNPKALRDDGESSPSSPPESATSPLPPLSTSA